MKTIELQIKRGAVPKLPAPCERLLSVWIPTVRKVIEAHLMQIDPEAIQLDGPVVLILEQFDCTAKGASLNRDVKLTIQMRVRGQDRSAIVHFARHLNARMRGQQMIGDITQSTLTIRDAILGTRALAALTEELVASDRFFSELSVNVLEKLDDALGRSSAGVVTSWRYAQYGVWSVTAIAMVVAAVAIDGPTQAKLMISAMAGFVVYLLSYAISVCFMPAKFFESYGAGKRVMRFAGTSTGQETLQTVRVASALLIVGLAAAGYAVLGLVSHE